MELAELDRYIYAESSPDLHDPTNKRRPRRCAKFVNAAGQLGLQLL